MERGASEARRGEQAKVPFASRRLPVPKLSAGWEWACAPAAALLGGLVSLVLFPRSPITPFAAFYVSCAVAAWLGGRRPGILAVLLSALAANFAVVPPRWAWATSSQALMRTAAFAVAAALVVLLCGSLRDVALRAERSTAALLRQTQLVALSHDAIFSWLAGGPIDTWAQGAVEMYGFSPEEAMDRSPQALLKTAFPVPFSEVEASLQSAGRWEGEVTHTAMDGKVITVSARLQLVRNGSVTRILQTDRDITPQKQAQEALRAAAQVERRSSALLRALTESIPDPVYVKDTAGRMLLVNPAALADIGKPEAQVLGTDYREYAADPEIGSAIRATDRQVVESGETVVVDNRFRTPRGVRDMLTTKAPLRDETGSVVGLVGISRDITERKRGEQEVRDAAEYLGRAIEQAPIPIAMYAEDGEVLQLSRAWIALTGYGAEEMPSFDAWLERVGGAGAARLRDELRELLQGTRPELELELQVRARDGRNLAWSVSAAAPGRLRDGRCFAVVMAEDLTERQQAEEERRAQEERLRLFVDHAPAAIAMFDREMRYLAVSRRFLQDYHLQDLDVIGRSHYEVFPEIPERWKQVHRRCLAGAVERSDEDRFVRADGSVDWVRWEMHPWRTASGEIGGIVLFSEVVTEKMHSAESLRQSEERFRLLIEGVRDYAIYMLAPDGTVRSWSAAAERIFGFREDEVLGRDRSRFFSEADRASGEERRQLQVAESTGRCEAQLWQCRKGGPCFNAEVLLTAIRDPAGLLRGFAAVTRDVTERERARAALQASEERLRLAQKVAQVGTFEWDLETGVDAWTPELEAMYGLKPGEFRRTQASWEQLVYPDDRAEAMGVVDKALRCAEPLEGEWRVQWPDGSLRWIAGRFQAMRDAAGRPRRLIGVNIDITERKRSEELRSSEAALRQADQQKNEFLAVLSHELRNPLAPVRNSLYVLARAPAGSEQARRAMEVIDRQVGHLNRLIDDLLDVTRITRGKIRLERERLDLDELVHIAVEDQRSLFARNGVELKLAQAEERVFVDGDRTRLAQVLGNLLQNAAKFTPAGGQTAVSVGVDPRSGEALLKVRDTGSGIAPEMLPRLFTAFVQAESTIGRSKQGLGLGLALVKGLVELHGGTVQAESEGEARGATFTIRLPLEESAEAAAADSRRADATRSRRILIVEYDTDAAESLRAALEMDGHVVAVARSGREGLEQARRFGAEVVISDLGLPDIDGFELARRARASRELAQVGLIALSGYATEEDVARAREAGFDAHLAKPPDIGTLERALARAVRANDEMEHQPVG